MSKRGKRLATLLMATVLTLGSAIPVSAANTRDEVYEFVSAGAYVETIAREKENSTSVYIKTSASYAPAIVQVHGLVPISEGSSIRDWKNCTYLTKEVTSRPGVACSIRSLVKEKGGNYAKLVGKSASAAVKTYGVWSPDSSQQYTLLN